MSKVIIIGGGAAGMMAGIIAVRNGHKVTIVEKNEKLGKKVYITGKGRCNLTNAGDSEDLMNSLVTNGKFMYGAFSRFSNYDCMGFFDELGLAIKVERGNRVFPESDRAGDVIDVLRAELRRQKAEILYDTKVVEVVCEQDAATGARRCSGVRVCDESHMHNNTQETNQRSDSGKTMFLACDSLIVATGGNSYQTTGSTGDGYTFAKELGHKITPIYPALVPMIAQEEWVKELQGLSLRNINMSVWDGNKEIYSEFGEMMFTHFGVTGPVVLSASSYVAKLLKSKPLTMAVDLKPALTEEQLDARVLRDFDEIKNKHFKNALDKLLPKKLIPVIIELSGIDENKQINEVTAVQRQNLVRLIKNLTFTITGLRGFNEAIITQGGVDVKEINPSTMQSKKVPNIYFAGEVLDVDAVTGGFNLQVAWSTAFVAASSIV